jgi:flagellar basal body-associated protein FliL
VNFLIKIEEAINQFIDRFYTKLKSSIPHFIFDWIQIIIHLPHLIKERSAQYREKIQLTKLKFIGYFQHYLIILRGKFTSIVIYLRSDEFKKADKLTLIMGPLKYTKANPLKIVYGTFVIFILSGVGMVILKNTEKIIVGTKAQRLPASMEIAEEDVFIELKNHKFEIKMSSGGGGHGGATEEHELDLFLDIKIEARDTKEKAFIEKMEKSLDHDLEALHLKVDAMPISVENLRELEKMILHSLNDNFKKHGHPSPIKTISLKQALSKRPVYYRQSEKMLSVTDINLQLFLEDTHRNRQVWIDFSIVASNRNAILYLTDHLVEFKDHLTTNVEPVIPQLPVEEEGRLIIKDKIKMELNNFLEKNKIEGKILDVYIDYLMAS